MCQRTPRIMPVHNKGIEFISNKQIHSLTNIDFIAGVPKKVAPKEFC